MVRRLALQHVGIHLAAPVTGQHLGGRHEALEDHTVAHPLPQRRAVVHWDVDMHRVAEEDDRVDALHLTIVVHVQGAHTAHLVRPRGVV